MRYGVGQAEVMDSSGPPLHVRGHAVPLLLITGVSNTVVRESVRTLHTPALSIC